MEFYIIITTLFVLLAASLFLIFGPVKSETKTNIWFGLFIFCAGVIGYINSLLQHYIIRNTVSSHVSLLIFIKSILSTMSYRFSPYFVLNTGISFTNPVSKKWQKRLVFILLIPIFLLYGADFILFQFHLLPHYPKALVSLSDPIFLPTAIYAISYVIWASILYLQAYFTAQNRATKKQTLLACILNLPVVVATYNTYIVRGFNYVDWKANFWMVFIFVALFLILLTKFSMLGYKLVITQQQFDGSMRAATTGALILNHAVKNELAKINFGIEILREGVQSQDLQKVLKIVSESTGHLSELVNRIKDQMQDMNLFLERCNLAEIVEPALDSIQEAIHERQIQLNRNYDPDLILSVDKCHLREVMVNVLRNAVEAMDQEGKLNISGYQQRKFFKLVIEDNGSGISQANLARVIEPFFSTKKFGRNYGLGLTYCYNVLRKHKGKLEIQSKEGVGTRVIIFLPIIHDEKEVGYSVSNKSHYN